MKTYFTFLLLALISAVASAQMDNRFYHPSKAMIPIDSLEFETISLPVENDTITAVLFKPMQPTPKATVFYVHGSGGNVSTHIKYARPLVADGFQVFMADFRGYGKSTGKPTHVNIVKDGQILFDYMQKHPSVVNTKIIVYGASIGSQAAVHLTLKNQGKISALVIDGGLSSMTDIALASAPQAQHNAIKAMLKMPYEAKEDIKAIAGVKLLFIHSREDKSVPFSQAEVNYANATAAKDFWIYAGDHLMAPILFRDEFLRRINQLLQ